MKETLDVGEVPASQTTNRPKPDSGQLRADAVSLDVPVKVHGSRVVEVIRGTTQHTEPFEEQTSTMIVFPLGGVLKMTTQVSVGQAIVLTNLKTHQDAICRVVKTRTNPNLHSYVEVEFSHPQPGYWGVRFSSDPPEPAKKTASPAAGVPIAPAPSAPKVDVPKSEIKEQKPTSAARPVPVVPPTPPRTEAPIGKHAPAAAPPPIKPALGTLAPAGAADSSSFSLDELRADTVAAPIKPFSNVARIEDSKVRPEETHPEAEISVKGDSAAHETPTFGRYAASAAPSVDRPARPAFGMSLEYASLGAAAEKGQSQGKNWVLIAACVGLVCVAAGGAFYFLHKRPTTEHAAAAVPAVPENSVAANTPASPAAAAPAPVQQTAAEIAPSAAPQASAPAAPPPPAARVRQAQPDKANRTVASEQASSLVQSASQLKVSQPARQKPAPAVPDMFGALNAHPTAAVHAGATESGAAPSIDSGALAGGQSVAVPSTEPSPTSLAPPPSPPQSEPEGPVMVGGDVKAPNVISSVPVEYPEIARQAGVEGNVVVRIVIDKAGKVTDAKALTGPMLLRDAAITALRQRKYAPSKLNGHPISVEMLVTIQFRR